MVFESVLVSDTSLPTVRSRLEVRDCPSVALEPREVPWDSCTGHGTAPHTRTDTWDASAQSA